LEAVAVAGLTVARGSSALSLFAATARKARSNDSSTTAPNPAQLLPPPGFLAGPFVKVTSSFDFWTRKLFKVAGAGSVCISLRGWQRAQKPNLAKSELYQQAVRLSEQKR
jgi:hypothetical protein